VKVPIDECGPLAVYRTHRLFSFRSTHSFGDQAADFRVFWGLEKNPQGVITIAKKML
jgi:hypothetical protein